jgi:hypothetical protein
MRFASKSQEYNRTVLQPLFDRVRGQSGETEIAVKRDGIMAQFEQMGLTAYERAQCADRFNFLGVSEGENPLRRVSIYDTDYAAEQGGWSADTKAAVEKNLLEGQNDWYFLLEEQRQPLPWPSYDDFTAPTKIAETVQSLGLDIDGVLAYERENKNRKTVIQALEALVESEPFVTA